MKLYKAIRFLMLSGILTLVLSRCIRESLEGCPLDTLLRFTYKPRGSVMGIMRLQANIFLKSEWNMPWEPIRYSRKSLI